MDFATPVDQPIVKRYMRIPSRQERPSAAMSEPVKPIVYYVIAPFRSRFAPPLSKEQLVDTAFRAADTTKRSK